MRASPDRVRFLVLTPAIDGADGISELSRQTVDALVNEVGAERVDVWALAGGAPPGNHRVGFRSARGRRSAMTVWTLGRLLTRLRDVHIVVMHAHLAPVAALLSMGGAEVSIFLMGVEVWTELRRRERFAFARADRLIAISAHTVRGFRAANPDFGATPIVMCAPGVRAEARAERIDDAGFALIVARLSSADRYKGHDALIDIWPTVQCRHPNARLLVVGDGDDRPRLEARVASAGLAHAIQFRGRVDQERLAALYRAAAFFVMPSTNEGFGLVYLEAMRAGKPCVALHGAADEIIQDGVSGILVDAGNSVGLTDAIVRLFVQPQVRTDMGRAAAVRIASAFTPDQFARRLHDALGLSTLRRARAATASQPVAAR